MNAIISALVSSGAELLTRKKSIKAHIKATAKSSAFSVGMPAVAIPIVLTIFDSPAPTTSDVVIKAVAIVCISAISVASFVWGPK